MSLSSKARRELKARAHHLKPVLRIGQQGLRDAVIQEAERCLDTHELIKVHIQDGEREARHGMAISLCQHTGADLVGSIGKTFILYRKRVDA